MVPNFAVLKSRLPIPCFSFGLFAGQFAKPDLNHLPDKLTDQVSVSTVEMFIGLFKLLHRGDAPILVVQLSGGANEFLAFLLVANSSMIFPRRCP